MRRFLRNTASRAVAFGPGNMAQAHTADEFVELGEVFRAAQIVEEFYCLAARLRSG